MKKFIPLAFVLVVFAACSSGNSDTKIETSADTTINADTVLDDQLFSQATGQNNLEKCKQISNPTRQDECKMVVEALTVTAEAVKALDVSLCQDIEDERYKENCESSVEDAITEEENYKNKLAEASKAEEARAEIEIKAMEKGDYEICNQIEDEGQKASCKFNVISASGNISLCDEIGDPDLIEFCKSPPEQED